MRNILKAAIFAAPMLLIAGCNKPATSTATNNVVDNRTAASEAGGNDAMMNANVGNATNNMNARTGTGDTRTGTGDTRTGTGDTRTGTGDTRTGSDPK